MSDQVGITAKGGTMRLGKYPCVLAEDSLARAAYGTPEISERHRHRYEFNNEFRPRLVDAGLRLAGLSPDGRLVEIVEEPKQKWFVGVQFHPEFKSQSARSPVTRSTPRSHRVRGPQAAKKISSVFCG